MEKHSSIGQKKRIKNILDSFWGPKYVDALLNHYFEGIRKYSDSDWEGVALKGGKFVEATTKILLSYCNQNIPRARIFKASNQLKRLEQLGANLFPDTIRIVIPKSCLFIYEIANNRGGRHDADEIDANEMDARAIIPLMSWVVAEMIRFAVKGKDPSDALALIESVTEKIYPILEEINGRAYVNLNRLSALDIALLLLYYKYPTRVSRQDLISNVVRHGSRKNAANVAIHRLKNLVDDENGKWMLRGLGRQRAEKLLRDKIQNV